MVYSVRVETDSLYLVTSAAIVLRVHRVIEQELRASLARIDLDGDHSTNDTQTSDIQPIGFGSSPGYRSDLL